MKYTLFLIFVTFSYALPTSKLTSEQLIEAINNRQTTWRAGKNFDLTSKPLRTLVGVLKRENRTLPLKVHPFDEVPNLLNFFDARVVWPNCPSIREIRDQASCASCWAFGAVEAMSDRICIHSQGSKQISVSAEDLMDCCGLMCGVGCYGGFPDSAWTYWSQHGIVSGGSYGTNEGCKPYSLPPCSHNSEMSSEPECSDDILTPMCVASCNEPTLSYEKELTFGESAYYIASDQNQIKIEIITNGPVEASFDVYEDFLYYKSGVYQNVEGEYLGGHAVKILGWGVEDDTPYWLVANSYGPEWGDQGYFKILRGTNHLSIEAAVVAGVPKL